MFNVSSLTKVIISSSDFSNIMTLAGVGVGV